MANSKTQTQNTRRKTIALNADLREGGMGDAATGTNSQSHLPLHMRRQTISPERRIPKTK